MDIDTPDSALEFTDLDRLSDEDIRSIIASANNCLVFNIKMHSVNVTNDPTDIAEDYVDAAFFAEKTGEYCSHIAFEPVYLNHGMLLKFTLVPSDADSLFFVLRQIQPWFDSEHHEPSELLRDEIGLFFDGFLTAKLRLPELGDKYMANFLAGSRYYENRRAYIRQHPTWKWGFWRSYAADQLKCELYTSSTLDNAWIVIGNRSTVERLLQEYGGYSPTGAKLQDATSIHLDSFPHLLVASQAAVHVPTTTLSKAIACWKRCIAPELARSYNTLFDLQRQQGNQDHFPNFDEHSFSVRYKHFEQKRKGSWQYRYGFSWAMTESGDTLVCGDDKVSFVVFSDSDDRVQPEPLRTIAIAAESTLDLLRDHAGIKESTPLAWGRLLPENFEDLCYDVLLRSGRFEEDSIRKHGKTRSRDGGRDIGTRPMNHVLDRFATLSLFLLKENESWQTDCGTKRRSGCGGIGCRCGSGVASRSASIACSIN